MSKLVFRITKIVPKLQEDAGKYDVVGAYFAEAYADLRKACLDGDLRIDLSVEVDMEKGETND